MAQDNKITLYSLDCGTVNWRLYRMEYHYDGARAQHVTSPLSSPLSNFSDRKLPAVLTLTDGGINVETIGETALAFLEDAQARYRVREFFKPSIGSHLIDNPSPHQQRYTHFEALLFTRLLLRTLIKQIQEEKYNSEPFDEGVHFSIAYPDRWRMDYDAKIFEDFYHVILECFPTEICEQVHFVPESEAVILGLRNQSLLEKFHSEDINLIVEVGGSHTTISARKYNADTKILTDISRYEEPFGGGLYDALLAKHISDELQIPADELGEDSSAFMALRIWGQLLKESLSRQISGRDQGAESLDNQQAITLVMKNNQVYRKNISMSPGDFSEMIKPVDRAFQDVLTRSLENMGIKEDAVGKVILLGGGVLLPGISEGIRDRFGSEKVVLPNNPEEIIVRGTGLSFMSSRPERAAQQLKHIPEKKSDWRIVHEDGTIVDITKEIMIAGRSQHADISMESQKCSRTHALIRLEGNVVTLIDLRSKNGTYVNQIKIEPNSAHYLRAGDQIRFGDQDFLLE